MGGVCCCYSWTRRLWPLLIILATLPNCVVQCSESPAVVGKMYPRGNHWAVGHLMGKKSIESPPAEGEGPNPKSDHLPHSGTQLGRSEPLMENQNQMRTQTADRLLRLHRGWREEDRDKYLRELSDLLLLALKLRGSDSA